MKTVLAATLALMVGLFVGGISPRSEIRKLKSELSDAKAAADRSRLSSAAPLALGGLFAAQAAANRHAPAPSPSAVPAGSPTPSPAAQADDEEDDEADDAKPGDGGARRR